MKISKEDYLMHYGVLRRSGRYPYGSGKEGSATHPWGHHENEAERMDAFLNYFNDLKAKGLSETEICKGVGITTTQYRAAKSIALNKQKAARISQAERLKATGMSNVAIGREMGINESSVRALLDPGNKQRADVLQTTASMLKDRVDSTNGFLDVGLGTERYAGVSATKMKAAVAVLEEQGYKVHRIKIPQLGTGKMTEMRVLCPPGTEWKEAINNTDRIVQLRDFSTDGGKSFMAIKPPISVDLNRVGVVYKEQGGDQADGVIYVRRGVEDLDMGNARYAQVRIAVNGTHFLKGMAMYKDDMPDGVDLLFNTNKSDTGNKLDAMKSMKEQPIDSPTYNPFGSFVRQLPKLDADGNPIHGTVRSAMNLVNEEGNWRDWSDNLATQMLSKQNLSLAKTQLDKTYRGKKADLEEIMSLTNPAVRKKLLLDYADDADAAAIHLKAMNLAGQKTHVILPMPSLKENEVYAPGYLDGDRVVLVRFPHGGTFEIPELVVNNKHQPAIKALGKEPKDAVAIHPKTAEILSGADFDGDTVLVIPNNSGKVKNKPPLQDLKGFDPKTAYPKYEGMQKMTPREKQREMGYVSNLITDMTIKGASDRELAAAVKHSMVVIDAEKHELNWRQSAIDNNISSLQKKYQGRSTGGADTLISKSGLNSKTQVPQRKQNYDIDPVTGKKIYKETGNTYVNKDGKVVKIMDKVPRLGEVDDAFEFSSGTPMEKAYAEHSNRMKALANQARREYLATKNVEYSPSARKTYAKEVARLESALGLALENAPRERQAQVLAAANVRAKKKANPDMDEDELKKIKNLALIEARNRTGASKKLIEISDSEWAAIQAGAVTQNTLSKILNNTDIDVVKQRSTPRGKRLMTTANIQKALSLQNAGYTQAEIAAALGVSRSTLQRELGS